MAKQVWQDHFRTGQGFFSQAPTVGVSTAVRLENFSVACLTAELWLFA